MKKYLIILAAMLMLLTFTSCDSSTSPGNQIEYGEMTDIDGNTYKTIQIGNQVWMAENLRVTHFRNGEPLNGISSDDEVTLEILRQSAYFNYDTEQHNEYFGKLYNWYAADDDRGLAPEGWRIPTEEDYQILVDYIGGEQPGIALKDTGNTYWFHPNIADNSSGFSARGGGCINMWAAPPNLCEIRDAGRFLTSTSGGGALYRVFRMGNASGYTGYATFGMIEGVSVRCIKNTTN